MVKVREGFVCISYAHGSHHVRNVYDIQPVLELGIETGYVSYAYGYVPVWRRLDTDGSPLPYSPSGKILSFNPAVWHNIYTPFMKRSANDRGYVICDRRSVINGTLSIPMMGLSYSLHFKAYLFSLGIENPEVYRI